MNISIKSPLPRIAFFALFFIMALLSICALAESAKSIDYYSDPQAIIEKISKHGADKVVDELFEDINIWLWVMKKISSGEDKWLQVAVALFPGTDALATETLFLALGEALVKAPNKVLTLFSDDFSIKNICSYPDVNDPRFDTRSKNLKELEKRKKSLLSLSEKKLKSVQKQCLKRLEESSKEVSEWFDAQK
jgi:hypothetical protein